MTMALTLSHHPPRSPLMGCACSLDSRPNTPPVIKAVIVAPSDRHTDSPGNDGIDLDINSPASINHHDMISRTPPSPINLTAKVELPEAVGFRPRGSTSEILRGQLYIGDLAGMLSGDWQRHDVGAIVSVLADVSEEVTAVVACHPSLRHMYYPLEDNVLCTDDRMSLFASPPSPNVFHVLEFMWRHTANNRRVLVHCEQGKQRSAAVCCAYLIWWKGFSCKDAIQWIQQRRKGAHVPGIWRTELDRLAQLACSLVPRTPTSTHPCIPDMELPVYQRLTCLAENTCCYTALRQMLEAPDHVPHPPVLPRRRQSQVGRVYMQFESFDE